ncbi:M28 family peptidase [Neptunitalea lumnitzerae]|uniref:Peptidase M28 domain-containing protein n=1 Tax=Neptunitalea lumnitzerae TaxID=2965509 RepID=A0ABQ5MJE2_9FLAO|nr:M28 family peptidase [Neptunitalea sp. Y10]GLB49536.1 hypothetical protein Y10_19040 [Neptunitalea sp. Y10]
MRKIIYVASALLVFGCGTQKQTENEKQAVKGIPNPVPFAETINEQDLKSLLYVYAGDEFQGRNTGDKGQKMAVDFLKNFYETHDIKAAKADGNYFQTVPLVSEELPKGSLVVNSENFELGVDAVTLSGLNPQSLSGKQLVYVGYGVETETYSDYEKLDVKGKYLIIKNGEPKKSDGTFFVSGSTEASEWSELRTGFSKKIGIAKNKGAAGVLFYAPESYGKILMQYKFMQQKASQNIRLANSSNTENAFAYFFISEAMATKVLENINKDNVARMLEAEINFDLKSDGVKEIESENVIAYIKGSEKPNEYVVISAHLDHLGMDAEGNVYNGADDDGSGTTAVLEIAEAFKEAQKAGFTPKRSVVFLHVTGEEKGLLGSEYYSENPVFSMEETVADLNIDMVGRIDPNYEGSRNYVYLIGSDKLSTDLHNLSEAMNNKYTNIELDYRYNDENDPNRFYYRSDHYNFAKHNVPIIFYFNGTHDDYHQLSDTPDKINYDLLANRAKLVFYTAWEIANRDQRLVVDKAVEEAK